MSATGDNWEYRPVRYNTGKIVVTEVYYTQDRRVCGIESGVSIPYHADTVHMKSQLKLYYPMVDQYDKYNPDVLDYIEEDDLAQWDFVSE